jgi:hypothetical protein
MPSYRIYLMDEVGTITSRVDHECADDIAATKLAVTLLPQRAQAEVWLGTRIIGSICAAAGLDASSASRAGTQESGRPHTGGGLLGRG